MLTDFNIQRLHKCKVWLEGWDGINFNTDQKFTHLRFFQSINQHQQKKRIKITHSICFTHSCRISQLHSILGHSHQTIHTGTYEWPHQYSQYTSRGCGRTTLPRNTRRRPPSNPLPNSLSHLHDCLPGLQIEQLHCHVVMEEAKVIHKIPEQEQAR